MIRALETAEKIVSRAFQIFNAVSSPRICAITPSVQGRMNPTHYKAISSSPHVVFWIYIF